MDLSLPDAQRYLFIRRAVERGFRVEDTSNHFQQVYATLASFVGDYENARKYYPLKDPAENPALRGFLTASPAIPILRALARSKQAVFVNEAHATAETRAAIYTFLRPLREEGYTYLAIEGLTSMPPLDGATCSDAILFDAELPVRGYPTAKSGFYIREPIFAEIIREALRLGFKLVAYETTDTADDSVEGREERQARNIACVFKGDPKAKLVAIAGFSHVNKSVNSELPGGWMASRFRSMTGIDPLTVDTTSLLHVPTASFHFNNQVSTQAYTLLDSMGRLYGSEAYDLILLIPGMGDRSVQDRSWLDLDGARHRVQIPLNGCSHTGVCLIEAISIAEKSAIPSDSCVISPKTHECTLYIPRGKFEINYFDDSYRKLGSRTISSD